MPDISDFLKSLAPLAPAVQLFAYSLLTVASVIVAVTQLRLAYRQNFGWKPIILVTQESMSMGAGADHYGFGLELEIWNRRKYPIRTRTIEISFQNLQVLSGMKGWDYKDWIVMQQTKDAYLKSEFTLGPSEHNSIVFNFPFAKRTLDDLNEPILITAHCFDPRANRLQQVTVAYRFAPNLRRGRERSWWAKAVRDTQRRFARD